MGTHALRFDPVSCVVTVVADGADDVQVLELSASGTHIARVGTLTSEHYSDVHGALVYVGSGLASSERCAAAVIADLPAGRTRAQGTALVRRSSTRVDVSIVAKTPSGEVLRLQLVCHAAGRVNREPVPNLSH